MATARAALSGFVLALAVVGCETRTVVPLQVASVEITPSSFTIIQGETESAQAVVRGPGGEVLSGRQVRWTTDAGDVATVDASGLIKAIGVGQTAIRADAESVRTSAPVTVLEGPSIALSPTAVSLLAVSGGESGSQVVTVENGGNGVLSGLSASVTYESSGPIGWLTAGLSGTNGPAELSVRASAAALQAGSYNATVSVGSSARDGLSSDLDVTFEVQPAPPAIQLDASEISFSATVGGQVSAVQDVAVTNGGDEVLGGLTTSVVFADGEPTGWLQATLAAPGAPTTLTLKASPDVLAVGTYHATVEVSSGAASNSPQTLTVVFDVASADAR